MKQAGTSPGTRIKYPLGVKLVTIITIILLFSLGIITFLVSVMVSADVKVTAEDNNFTVNHRSTAEAETTLKSVMSNVVMLLNILDTWKNVHAEELGAPPAVEFFFEQYQDIGAILVPGKGELINTTFFLKNEIDQELTASFIAAQQDAVSRAAAGEILLLNGTPTFGMSILVLCYPWQSGTTRSAVIVFFSSESIVEAFGTGANASYMINGSGDVLVHPDQTLVRAGKNIRNLPFVQSILESPDRSRQTLYTNETGVRFFGAFQKLSLINAVVITEIPYTVVFEGIMATTRRNIYLTIAVLCISTLFIWFFSKSISIPLKALTKAAGIIEEGEFELDLQVKTKDEIGVLTRSFVQMGKGLAERERLKDAFGRFTNKELAERAMRGELSLGGETKMVTVFFSDIRSFTAISEKLEPHEVVEFLNDYMTQMVQCVNKTGGSVDKFIGDAVMAIWGTPVSTGNPAHDALNCVKTALMMRAALQRFNQGRGGDKKPIIKIGCGINTGDVVAGQIGSQERMEYTVIGDPVNLASRTEALNKPFGTDILITENTWQLIHKYLLVEEMPAVTVKGKEQPVRMFAVVNLRAPVGKEQPSPKTLGEVRKLLGIATPDLSKVDTDAEEKKYKIQEP
jgi:adenylate cyclase